MSEQKPQTPAEVIHHHPEANPAEITVAPVEFVPRAAVKYIKQRNQAEQERAAAEKLAYTDELTGLLNRRGFEQVMDSKLSAEDAASGRYTLFWVDLDGFKSVNDNYGHNAGDELLQAVAKKLRPSDSIIAARAGGDEFIVVSDNQAEMTDRRSDERQGPGRRSPKTPEEAAQSFAEQLSQRVRMVGQEFGYDRVGASVGFQALDGSMSMKDTIDAADKMMQENKNRMYAETGAARRQ